ncbi:MAG: hypothetical protein NC213_07960 [Acetobacter sp.]|nr:hypothetical protein [Bacteroides sp.]MCM1341665.1 hypothetical protein [Acetobacter sp.]MCM1434287.1 hypothetical protein [Clostridiales bacterium]
MKIIDTFNDISKVYKNGVFDKALWDNYADSVFPGLKDKVENDFSRVAEYKDKVYKILNDVPKNFKIAETAHQSFINATKNLSDEIKNQFNVDLNVTIILYLGLGNGAGWETTINNQKVVLIGLEKVVELGWCSESYMQALIYHELGHVYHSLFEHKNIIITKKEKSIRQLYREGIAMVFEQTLCDDVNRYHQDIDGWLDWCKDNEKLIKTEYLKRIKNTKNVQDFFGDWCSFMNHSDVGYYLGTAFIRFLMNDYSLQEIASMKLNTVLKHFYIFTNK